MEKNVKKNKFQVVPNMMNQSVMTHMVLKENVDFLKANVKL